ncbi:MAG TPA: hypothetical protein VH370_08820 [Humisphaera sp.]|nr:hypothetical protein [Humisphaera sp.]
MKPSRRWAFNAAAMLSAALFVAAVALWVRSNSVVDRFTLRQSASERVELISTMGGLSIATSQLGPPHPNALMLTESKLIVPYPLLALACASICGLWLATHWRRTRTPGICAACGYDLRATPHRCPECGAIPTKS